MAKDKIEITERDPAPIPIDPREDSGQATPAAVHPIEDTLVGDLTGAARKIKVGDDVEYCVGYRNAGVDRDGNSLREPVFTSAKVLELDEDHREGHIKLSYRGENGKDFQALAHHFAGRPGYWQFAGEEPAKDDEE